jgi:hypothetical protein
MLNEETTESSGEVWVELVVEGVLVRNRCLVAPSLVCNADIILGFDVIKRLGGVLISKDGCVSWGPKPCATAVMAPANQLKIEDTDFLAVFDGNKWTVEWKWQVGSHN